MNYNNVVNIKIPKKDKVEGFDPDMLSVVFAINSESLESDLEVIKTFSNEPVTVLQGSWEGKTERSYQVAMKAANYVKFYETMITYNQDSFIYMSLNREAVLYDVKERSIGVSLGTMQETTNPASYDNITYCPTTDKYWRAF